MKDQFSVPILLLVFNRPVLTARVFETIRKQKPTRLFVAADGPRPKKVGDEELCRATREVISKGIDWDCELRTFFRETNVGCGKNVSESITWFFEQVEEGIILEDDCLPDESFFAFCEELLEKYRNVPTISAISGNNFQKIQPMRIKADYYFSAFPSSWGWASWRRSWTGYKLLVSDWEGNRNPNFAKWLFREKGYQLWWENQYRLFYDNKLDHTWDFQFHFHTMMNRQLAIVPAANLVSNIGHGPDATNFHDPNSHFANLPTYPVGTPLKHPDSIDRNYEADVFIQNLLFGVVEVVSPLKKAKRLIKRVIRYAMK